jgi:hypothetical protein
MSRVSFHANSIQVVPETGDLDTGVLQFFELRSNGTSYLGFKAPIALATSVVWTLPNSEGAAGTALTTDGSGTLSWQRVWLLNGNAGTSPGTDFMGTTDAQDVVFKSDGVERLRIYATGGLNIPTTTSTGIGVLYQNGTPILHTLGAENFFAGSGAGGFATLTTGQQNVAVGVSALQGVTSASENAAFGYYALSAVTTGNNNIGVGSNAGATLDTGSNNILLGYYTNVDSASATNRIAIGTQAYVTQDNSMVLGSINGVNSAISDTNVGIGTTAPSQKLEVKDGHILISNTGTPTGLKLQGSSSGVTTIKGGAQGATDIDYVLPAAQGAAATFLKNDGSGNLSWDTGPVGPQGPTGPQGSAGQNAGYYEYNANTTTYTGDPGAGFVIWDNATQTSATQINIDHLTSANDDIDVFLALLSIGDTIILQDQANSANYQVWVVNAAPIPHVNDYYEYPVTLSSSTHTFSNNDPLLVIFISGGGTTLQTAYQNGNTITTNATDGDLAVTLDPATSFTISGTAPVIKLDNGGTAAELRFYEPNASGTNYTGIKAQAQAADVALTLPAAQGNNYDVLSNDGSGTMSWQPQSLQTAYEYGPAIPGAVGASSPAKGINTAPATGDLVFFLGTVSGTTQFMITGNEPVIVLRNQPGPWPTTSARLRFVEPSGGSDYYTQVQAQYQTGNINWVLPTSQGGANTYLKNDGSGNLSWDTVTGGSTVEPFVYLNMGIR